MAVLDTTALAAVLKVQYTQSKVRNLAYPKNPFFAQVKKRTDFVGANKQVAVRYGNPQARGAAFATALANMSTSSYVPFVITRKSDYAFAQITNEAILASANDSGALLRGLKAEIDGAMYTATRSICTALFRNSGGARGQISSGSSVAGTTITLANISDVVNFEKGMVLNLSAADGTSGAKRTGTVTLTAVDRDAGTLTASANWNTITGAAVSDYIFQNGDIEATKSMLSGLGAWLPLTAPTGGDNFFGVDRSVDPVRLAGVRYSANAGGPIEETLTEAAWRVYREGGVPDTCYLNPQDFSLLVRALATKVIYDRAKSFDESDIGFKSVQLMGPGGPINIIAEINCPKGYAYMLQLDTWSLETLGSAPMILGEAGDGLKMLRDTSTDSYVLRIGYYGNLICEAPGWNAVVTL